MSNPGPSESLRLSGVFKVVEDFAISADFEVGRGERAALIGPSGSGKTTLLRLIAGLEFLDGPRDAGRIFISGADVTTLAPQKRGVGFLFQDHALFPALDVLDNITFGLRMKGISREEREAEAQPWLDKLGLKSLIHARIGRLSGGEAQRVAFVRSLIWKPKVLLLDEPFSALDTELRRTLRNELVELHQLWPVPLVLVSHDPVDLEAVATVRLEFGGAALPSATSLEIRSVRRVQP